MTATLPVGGDYDLAAKYERSGSAVALSGTQAMVRLILDQLRRDAAAGLRTGAFVSGYPGSPLGGLDLELARNRALVEPAGVRHVPGHNEELAATAVWGSQAAQTFDDATHDGVLGVWYGKGPGLDRASDAIRHAQYIGTSRHGGVVALVGEDPACKSSSIPHSTENALRDIGLPTLFPGHVGDIVELGPHAVAMSRLSGLWSAMRIVTSVADGTRSVTVEDDAPPIVVPELEWRGELFVPTLNSIPCPPWSIQVEEEIVGPRVDMAREYGYLNGLNPVTADAPDAWLGVVAVGHQHAELVTALGKLDLTLDQAAGLGVRVLNVRQPWPLDPRTLRDFAHGLSEILVIEEKRSFVEGMVREALYGSPDQPVIVGRTDERGSTLLPAQGAIDADVLLPRLRSRMSQRISEERMRPARHVPTLLPLIGANRAPYFCSGCPHNTSTRVPDGALVGGGIGCHSMAQFMEPEITGATAAMTHMGAEGAQWIGIEPYIESDHMFQNIGDGTYFHSGQLAVQAAIAAGSHITYKLLYNDAIAMTGGQETSESNAVPVPVLVEILLRQGVRQVLITTDDRSRYKRVRLPRGVEVWDRSRIIEAQETLAQVPGVTVLIHDQRCAAELRRDRKRKKVATPRERIFINERVCEGCGDCGYKSNCLSVEPVDTDYGRKTRINQDSCNLDFSCLKGDCPSFIKVTLPETADSGRGGKAARRAKKRDSRIEALLARTPREIALPEIVGNYTVRMPGIGGTGVVTASQILGTAALLDGRWTSGLDQTGLSQKAGPVISDLIISQAAASGTNKVAAESADLVLGFDVLVTGSQPVRDSMLAGRTAAVISTARTPTGRMVSDVRSAWPDQSAFQQELEDHLGADRIGWIDAEAVARGILGSAAGANILLIGVAFQRGTLPISASAIERAITLNGVAVTANINAFRLGRLWVDEPDRVSALLPVAVVPEPRRYDLGDLDLPSAVSSLVAARAAELVDYQDDAYAQRFLRTVSTVAGAEARVDPTSHALTEAVAESLFKLMAYKDEYEVARLSLDPAVRRQIQEEFGDDVKIAWQLHPPVLRDRGMKNKLSLGEWFTPGYRALTKMKRLRGTRLDPFGRTESRRLERQLAAEFEALAIDLAERLDTRVLELAVEIAELPDVVRGYEGVKADSAQEYHRRLAELRDRFDQEAGAA